MTATFAGHWGPEPFIDLRGNARADADVYVYTVGTTTPITLYANRAKSATITNPLPKNVAASTAGLDANGNGDFYAVPGEYRMVAKVAGVSVFDDTVTVANDQADGGGTGTAIYTDVSAAPYSATGTNATADAVAIQAAIDAVSAAGGGTVFFPKLYDVDVPIIAKSNVRFLGHHSAKSGVRRKQGVNFAARGVVESPALLATQVYNVKFERFCIDGNYGQFGQDAVGTAFGSRGLNLYAVDTQVEDLWVRNCKDRGVYHTGDHTAAGSEAGNPIASSAWWHNFRVSNSYGDHQFHWSGPTDAHFDLFWIYLPDHPNAPANIGMYFDSSGHKVSQGHIWGEAHKVGLYDAGSGNMQYTTMVVESAGGVPASPGLAGSANVVLEGGGKLFHGLIYDNAATHANKTGIRLGTSGGASLQESKIAAHISQCFRGGVDFANAGPAVEVQAVTVAADIAAEPYIGTIPAGAQTRFTAIRGAAALTEVRVDGRVRFLQSDAQATALSLYRNAFGGAFLTSYMMDWLTDVGTFLAGISNHGSLDLAEIATTPAAVSNRVRLYAVDDGTGRTNLIVKCDSGDALIVASQAGGPVLKAPDNSLHRLVVDNAGALSTVAYP